MSDAEKAATMHDVRESEGMDGWIAPTERLPEAEQEVLCYTTLGAMEIGYQECGVFSADLRGTPDNPELVTHWMPLPAPPESGQ